MHTATSVYSSSFTLFATICALGCAVSNRPRDQLLYPVLYNIAEQDIKWSMVNSVKSVETIQAIINFTYWCNASERHADETSWLKMSHVCYAASPSFRVPCIRRSNQGTPHRPCN